MIAHSVKQADFRYFASDHIDHVFRYQNQGTEMNTETGVVIASMDPELRVSLDPLVFGLVTSYVVF